MGEGLRGRIDLIVISGSRKARQFGDVVREPWCIAWQKHKTIFEPRRLGMQESLL